MAIAGAAIEGNGERTVLPVVPQWVAPAHWRSIDFLSDLHLAADRPNTVAAFARHLRQTPADAVFILGDLFDLWVGDDARHDGIEAQIAAVLTEASSRRTLAFMAGNRDFLVGAKMLQACGVTALADPTVLVAFEQRLMLSHGDAWCLADVDYQRFRVQVRDPQWQRAFLALPLSERIQHAAAVRSESERRKQDNADGLWADVDATEAVRWMEHANTPALLHGHTHRPGSEPLAPGRVRHVLSDWELDDPEQTARAEVLRWSAAGLRRLPPAGAVSVAPRAV